MRHLPLVLFTSILLIGCHPDVLNTAPPVVADAPVTATPPAAPPSTPPAAPPMTPPSTPPSTPPTSPPTPPTTPPAPPPVLTGFFVEPYLQNPTPNSMVVMFEPSAATAVAKVEYRKLGDTAWLSANAAVIPVQQNATAQAATTAAPYTARLAGLSSNTTHEYRVVTDAGTTPVLRFKTWPLASDTADTARFMVISDTQSNNPDWLKRVMEEGLITKDCDGDVHLCTERIHGVIVSGDIVDDGDNLEQWRDTFFGPARNLFRYVPILPAIGNHDYDLKHYLIYFDLPDNGSATAREEWYRKDFQNFRLLTLQTNINANGGAGLGEQTSWVQREITQATQDGISYLFASFHHPCKSEFWIPGESEQSCTYVDLLQDFSTSPAKIGGHFFGHTHAYSRGQSRDVSHLWMNAASASGNIDDWGDFEQADYDEFESSWDEYGYSIVEYATKGTPRVKSIRRSGGDDFVDYADAFSEAKVRDVFTIGGDNRAPVAPVPTLATGGTVNTAEVMLHARYSDPDGDALHEAHWQLRSMVGTYEAPLLDQWGNETRRQNVWFRRDLNQGIDVDYWRVPYLAAGSYCWRVRHRDAKLAWSPWSAESCFAVSGTQEGANLVTNGSAENGITGWTVTEGTLEAVLPANCRSVQENLGVTTGAQTAAIVPPQGARFFAVGGCTDVSERARAVQGIDVSASAAAIDAGHALGVLRASLRTFTKWDVPTVRFTALDASGKAIAEAKPLINQTGAWVEKSGSLLLPKGTRRIEVALGGVQQDGVVNDSFVDNVRFHVVTQTGARQVLSKLPVLSPGNGMALIAKKPDIAGFEASVMQGLR